MAGHPGHLYPMGYEQTVRGTRPLCQCGWIGDLAAEPWQAHQQGLAHCWRGYHPSLTDRVRQVARRLRRWAG